MTAATSPRSSATCTALMSFGGQITTWSSRAPGTPADIGPSYGGVTAATAPSCPPGEGPRDFPIFDPPGLAPATRTARGGAPVTHTGERTTSAPRLSPR